MGGGTFYVATFDALIRHLDAHMKAVHKKDTLNKEMLRGAKSIVERDSEDFQDDFELKIHLFNGVFIYHNGDRSMEMNVEWKGDRLVSECSTITGDIPIATFAALDNDLSTKLQKVHTSDTKTREMLREVRAFVARENRNFHGNYELKVHLPSDILTYHNGDRSMEMNVEWKGDRLVSECLTTVTGGDIPIATFAALDNDLSTKLQKVHKSDTKTREILREARAFVARENRNLHGNYELKVHLSRGIITYHNGDRSNSMHVERNGDRVESGYVSKNMSTNMYDTGRSVANTIYQKTVGLVQKEDKD